MKKFTLIFLSSLICSFSYAQKLKKLGIEFESVSYNFGEIQMWENQPAIFTLSNKSKYPISILPLFSENDLEIIYPEHAIQPGESAIVKAVYYTSGTGPFVRKFPIYFNTSPEAYDLKITGNIKSLSPTAYIQCPQAKPEHSKPKIELFGSVAESESEIPLSGSVVRIVSLTSKNDLTFYADKNGNFGSSLPSGNYEVFVEHPNYEPHQSFFYLGQTSGHLKIKLSSIVEKPILTSNILFSKENTADLAKKQEGFISESKKESLEKVSASAIDTIMPDPAVKEENIISKNNISDSEITKETNAFKLKEDVPYSEKNTAKNPTTYPTPSNIATTIKEGEIHEATKSTTPKETYNYSAQKKEAEPIPYPVISSKKYTVRIINQKTLEPVGGALVFANQLYNKAKTIKLKSDETGMAQIPLEKEDYRIIVNADNYISGETKIRANQDDEIIRIYLSPVSNLFNDIYTTKKQENDSGELLNQLSFGKTEFSFVKKDELETVEPKVSETIGAPIEISEPIPESVITTTSSETTSPVLVENKVNLDSIQRVLAEIEAEKLKMELELAKKELELNKKEALLTKQENELAEKDYELESKTSELEKQKLALDELSKKEVEQIEKTPTSLELSKDEYAANNVLFLIDISSSMGKENKMELLKESIKSLTMVLRDVDKVAIITYNQNTTVVLESVSGADKNTIIGAVDSLQTSGLTYGVDGLQTAYDLLQYHHISNGNNQIILATDGLFSSVNNKMTENELNKEVQKQVSENNIKLSVIGFGQDENGEKLMEKLAEKGSGQFIKIKNPWQAKTVLIEEIKINSKL